MRALHLAGPALSIALALAACGASVHAVDTTPPPPPAAASSPVPATSAAPALAESPDASLDAEPPAESAAVDTGAPPAPASTSACNEQPPQDFLVRGTFLRAGPGGNQRAIQYRTDHYGYFHGFGRPGPDAQPPRKTTTGTTFMGLPITLQRKVVPALHCVEEEIKLTCADHPYTARALSGLRTSNTYRGGEVSNHVYGIAIDIDPAINVCCGCVKPWSDAPLCKRHSKTEYDRMAMPECWVHVFERYGFYWLGHDVLRDTMHFEFLGDPDRVVKDAHPAAPEPSSVHE